MEHKAKQRSELWFAIRKGRVTGSAVGAILGMSPFSGPGDVMRGMVRDYHGAESEFSGNVATEYGTAHEPMALADYEMETGNTVDECGFFTYKDWLGASPDGLMLIDGKLVLLEIKCPYGKRDDKKGGFKSIKDQQHYYAQMQLQMFATSAKSCHFYQWNRVGKSKLEIVDYNEQWIDENMPKLKKFHNKYMKDRELPEAQKHLDPRRAEIDTLEAVQLMEEYTDLQDAIDRTVERKKEVLAKLVQIAKEKDSVINGRNLTKVVRKGSVSYAKVVKDHCADVDLESYRGKESISWVIR